MDMFIYVVELLIYGFYEKYILTNYLLYQVVVVAQPTATYTTQTQQ
jgi:hypothetical protein